MHDELAEHLGADQIDYRRRECLGVACDERGGGKPKGKKLEGVEWADMNTLGSRVLGGTDTIAQVSFYRHIIHPYLSPSILTNNCF